MQKILLIYLKNPTLANFLALRSAHLDQEGLDPYSGKLIPVSKHLSAGKYREAAELISKHLIPDYIMSAGTHLELAVAQKGLGLPDKAEFERFLAQRLVIGIEMTGQGSEARPFLVTRTSDEYDFLIYRKQTPSIQSLVESRGRRLDRIETQSGEVFWFDITEVYALMQRARSGKYEG
jgi:hypothetical protein